jgi:hypothetical protein
VSTVCGVSVLPPQLIGLVASVGVLRAIEASGRPESVVPVWVVIHAVHVALRYRSLATLTFPYPNQKRAAAMVSSHVRHAAVPGVAEVNRNEAILASPETCSPRATLGCTVDEAIPPSGPAWEPGQGGTGSSAATQQWAQLADLAEVYNSEQYMLTWRGNCARVLMWDAAGPGDALRAMWQAAWLEKQVCACVKSKYTRARCLLCAQGVHTPAGFHRKRPGWCPVAGAHRA